MSFQRVEKFIDELIENGLPEAQVIVNKDGKEVYRYIAGFSDFEKKRKADFRDLFRLYSMSKVVTMTATMRLVERGKLSLDEPIGTYLPSFKTVRVINGDGTVTATEPLTLRRLMSMTGGYHYVAGEYPFVSEVIKNKKASTQEVVNAFAKEPLKFEPGSHFEYSFCHDIVAGVIESVSGVTLGEFLKREIFNPLGIVDMGFKFSPEQKSRLAQKYVAEHKPSGIEFKKGSDGNWLELTENYESGGAGLFGNAEEYIKLADALANGGVAANGYRVLSEESIDIMRTDQLGESALKDYLSVSSRAGYGYGLGVRTLKDPIAANAKSAVGEFGWDGAAGSYVLIDPQNKISIVYIEHVMNHGAQVSVHPKLRNLVYECLGL